MELTKISNFYIPHPIKKIKGTSDGEIFPGPHGPSLHDVVPMSLRHVLRLLRLDQNQMEPGMELTINQMCFKKSNGRTIFQGPAVLHLEGLKPPSRRPSTVKDSIT
jgi:hypothetical protein